MSEWYRVTKLDSIDLSEDGKTIDINFAVNDFGNVYAEIPTELLSAVIPQWQPIESINDQKKDRYYLFGGYDGYGNWVSNKFHFSLDGFINGWCMLTVKNNGITHWMPLPTPPKEQP